LPSPPPPEKEELDSALWEFLGQVEEWLETPMVILGFVWLLLLAADLIWGLSEFLRAWMTVIWVLFALDLIVRFLLAPSKRVYLRRNWLLALSLAVPAVRIVRVVRVLQVVRLAPATRTLHMVAVVGSLNRGMRALRSSMSRHGAQYILALTVLVILVSAAGMYAFERTPGEHGLGSYGEAVWWTVMIVTTIGSDFWPVTAQGRILTVVVAIYSFGVLGFVTAAIASFLVERDAESEQGGMVGRHSVAELREEIRALREELERSRPDRSDGPSGG
jgi:voltage-gated potassium channel